jgi:hypothetical protein
MTPEANKARAIEWLSAWGRFDRAMLHALTHTGARFCVFGPLAKLTGHAEVVGGEALADLLAGETMVRSDSFPFTSLIWSVDHAVAENDYVFLTMPGLTRILRTATRTRTDIGSF